MTTSAAFRLERTRVENRPRPVTVARIEDLTPTYRRITLAGDFSDFQSLGADDHLRIFPVPNGTPLPEEHEARVEAIREHPSREYTPVAWAADTLTLDFVIHGDGPASTWAMNARVGSVALIGGPRGSMQIDGSPDFWLLAGDRTALPAIRRHLSAVRAGTPVDVLLVAEDPADEQLLESAGDLTVTWVRSQAALAEALETVPSRAGAGFAFIAAEQSIVKPGRAFLAARGIDLDRAVVKGYWKRGEAEYHEPR